MVMKPEPLLCRSSTSPRRGGRADAVVLLTPQGRLVHAGVRLNGSVCLAHVVLLCGEYEGMD